MTTVKQMIEALKLWPEDMMVIVRGYEGGYCEASLPHVLDIALNVHTEWYYGPHEDANDYKVEDHEIVKALLV